jgi:hypothetical protein
LGRGKKIATALKAEKSIQHLVLRAVLRVVMNKMGVRRLSGVNAMHACNRAISEWFAVAPILLVLVASPSYAQKIFETRVTSGQTEVLRLDRNVHTITLGNPRVADATVAFGNAIILTGKGPGVTNLIAFDAEGREIVRAYILVSSGDYASVRIYNGTRSGEGHLCSISSCIPSRETTVGRVGAGSASEASGLESPTQN